MYITEGKGIFYVNDEALEAEAGMLFIINPNEPHHFFFDPQTPVTNYECTFLFRDMDGEPKPIHFFDLLEANRSLRPSPELFRTRMYVPSPLRPLLLEGYQRILQARKDGTTKEYLSVIVLDLILRVEDITVRINGFEQNANVRTEDHAVATVKQYLRAQIGEKILLQELADVVHLTPNYLCTLFKEHTGTTLMNYLKQIRMREAEKLLTYTDLSIYRIAEDIGFEEASYFTKVFRKTYGVSPTEFRNNLFQPSVQASLNTSLPPHIDIG
jgi:AraC-like DNA-binding protein